MKLSFTVNQPSRCRNHTTEIDLIGYYGTEEVIQDFEKVIELHRLKHEDRKRRFTEQWGEEAWNKVAEQETKTNTNT